MSEQDPIEAVCECGHAWSLRKPPGEMTDGPRCSECGAREGAITVTEGSEQDETEDEESVDVVTENRCVERRAQLKNRIDALLDTVEGSAPDDVNRRVAKELRGPAAALEHMREILDDGDGLSLEDLDDAEARLEDLAQEIEQHADGIEAVEELPEARTNLTRLRRRREELAEKIEEKEFLINQIQDRDEAWKEGYDAGHKDGRQDARQEYEIPIPCGSCGKMMTLRPGTKMHDRVAYVLSREGWSHSACQNQHYQSTSQF